MLAGTFYWFRNDQVFTNSNWSKISRDRYAAEAWPSGLCEWTEAASMYQLWPEDKYPTPSPYDPENYPEEFPDD
jgi:hypothetical protein